MYVLENEQKPIRARKYLQRLVTESSGLVVITAVVHSGGPGFDPGGRPPWGGLLCFPPHLQVNTGLVPLQVGHSRIPSSLPHFTVHLQFTSQFTLTELANDLSRSSEYK